MSEYQMQEIIEELRGLRKDLKENLECITMCMILNTVTNNGARDITAQERLDLLKAMSGEQEVKLTLYSHLMHAPRPRSCKGEQK